MLYPMYFQPNSFQQANPLLTGLQQGQAIVGQGQENQMRGLQNALLSAQVPYAPQMAQQGLLKQQLANALSQNTLNYAPQTSQANINMLNSDAARNAASAWQTRNFPVQSGVPGTLAYMSYLAQTKGINSPEYKLAAENAAAQNNMLNNRAAFFGANIGLKNVPTAAKYAMIGSGYIPGTLAAPPVVPTTLNNAQPGTVSTTPNNTGASPPYNVAQVQKTAQMSANQALTTPQQKNRYQAGVALENLVNTPDAQNAFNTLANYSGLEGQLKAQTQRLTNPSAYLQYQNAQNQFNSIISGGLKVLEGYPSTDQAVNIVKSYFSKAQSIAATDPVAATNYINQGLKYLKDETNALQQVNQPIFSGNNYQNNPVQNAQVQSSPVTQPTANSSARITVIDKNGRRGTIPANNLQAALKAGYRQE